MRIVFDLQACQTSSSRNRGIGRYSLALMKAIAKRSRGHDIWLAMNARFESTIEPLRDEFADMIPRAQMVTFHGPRGVAQSLPDNQWRIRSAEILRNQFLNDLKPDIVHTASVVEGLGEDAIIGASSGPFLAAATIYDLIPLVYRDVYLQSDITKNWYYRRLQQLKSSDILLAISEHTRREAIDYLHLVDSQVVNISAGVDPTFIKQTLSHGDEATLRLTYGIDRPFVMYTGGVDFRKNLDGLIKAYAELPSDLRQNRQLAIVCSVNDHEKDLLKTVAQKCGLSENELVLTGYVPHDDLIALYNICELFVFPSLSEGFGLPVLEAMACGAPVIASNRSSIPEVLGLQDALFDPHEASSFVGKLTQALTQPAFRSHLQEHSARQFGQFTWERSADRTLDAFEAAHDRRSPTGATRRARRPKLAYVSPVLPTQSGIASYSSELLPDLAKYYDIDLVVDQTDVSDPWLSANYPVRSAEWFKANANSFDRILYQMGNSSFHGYMFDLMSTCPGVVTLHDFYLSGMIDWMDQSKLKPGCFAIELYNAHGFAALASKEQIIKFPTNKSVIDSALGLIVHSQYSIDLSRSWYTDHSDDHWALVPQVRRPDILTSQQEAKNALGFESDSFIVACFGIVHATKQNDLLLEAFLASQLAKNPRCYLVMVGDGFEAPFFKTLQDRAGMSSAAGSVRFTGFVDAKTFDLYLQASDIAVQLRQMSRGETSRAALDAMSARTPLIVNACGSMNELPDDCLVKLPEHANVQDVTLALEMLWLDGDQRQSRMMRAEKWVKHHHHPSVAAQATHDAIERFYEQGRNTRILRMLGSILDSKHGPVSADDVAELTTSVALSFPSTSRRLLLDLTGLKADSPASMDTDSLARSILMSSYAKERIEPVQFAGGRIVSALPVAADLARLEPPAIPQYRVQPTPTDTYIVRNELDSERALAQISVVKGLGAQVYLTISGVPTEIGPAQHAVFDLVDAVICNNQKSAEQVRLGLSGVLEHKPVGFLADNGRKFSEPLFTWLGETPAP